MCPLVSEKFHFLCTASARACERLSRGGPKKLMKTLFSVRFLGCSPARSAGERLFTSGEASSNFAVQSEWKKSACALHFWKKCLPLPSVLWLVCSAVTHNINCVTVKRSDIVTQFIVCYVNCRRQELARFSRSLCVMLVLSVVKRAAPFFLGGVSEGACSPLCL